MPTKAPIFTPKSATRARKKTDRSHNRETHAVYDAAWDKVRKIKLSQNPLCEECLKEGFYKLANVVHHLKTVRERPDLRLELTNLQSICTKHHGIAHSHK